MNAKTVFVSHAVKDKVIIDAFVDIILNGGLSITADKIFCVSTDGMKIQSGEDWRQAINKGLKSAKLIFLIITPHYKESEMCLNEMGAAWVSDASVIPLIIDPINYKTVGIIQEPNQIERLLDEGSLDRIKDIVQQVLGIPPGILKSDRWTVKKKEFLATVRKDLNAYPFPVPMDRAAFERLQKDNQELSQTVDSLIEEKAALENLNKDLQNAKDKEEVKRIVRQHQPNTDFEDFEEAVSAANKALLKFHPIVIGIIFQDFSGKKLKINWESYREQIDEAVANDFITEELEVDRETTQEILNARTTLMQVREILQRNLGDDFNELYSAQYDAPLKLDNKTFWEKVFDIQVFL